MKLGSKHTLATRELMSQARRKLPLVKPNNYIQDLLESTKPIRWVAQRKAALIEAVRAGTITIEDACQRYKLSIEEFTSWERTLKIHGVYGLRATRLQIYQEKWKYRSRYKRPRPPNYT